MFRWKDFLGVALILICAIGIGILQIPLVSGMASGGLVAVGISSIIVNTFFRKETLLDVLKRMEKFGYKKFVNIVLGGLILSALALFYFLANPNSSFIATFFSTFFFAIFMLTAMALAPIGMHHEEWTRTIKNKEKERKD